MDGQFLDEQRAHFMITEVALVEPVVAPRDFVGTFRVADNSLRPGLIRDEKKLLGSFIIVDFEETVLGAWPLILHSPSIDFAEDKFQKLPGTIEIAFPNTPHSNFE